jgi:hypothetical protein
LERLDRNNVLVKKENKDKGNKELKIKKEENMSE